MIMQLGAAMKSALFQQSVATNSKICIQHRLLIQRAQICITFHENLFMTSAPWSSFD